MVIEDWSLGDKRVTVPHAWGEETDLRWEGPAVYTAEFTPGGPGWLVFHGVSAHAKVSVNGIEVAEHLGIWDAFSVRLSLPSGVPATIAVSVTKNGGDAIPVNSIASGFLPYVFGTFGGIFRPVEWIESDEDPLTPLPPAPLRAAFNGRKLYVDGNPTVLRGILHWGWYPRLRHPHPDVEACRSEIASLAAMGFNCVKFCLWTPPHHYLKLLEEAGMYAWMELPVWNPAGDIRHISGEIERIVQQYRHHPAIVLWTVGCELGNQMTREDREKLFRRVKELTNGALVKDSSGGAEMYGGDPVEFGDFDDFHPYCDLAEYPKVLDALQPGARRNKAILFGECNDFDSIRDIVRLVEETPYWASEDPFFNAQGVRWQYDLPGIVARHEPMPERIVESSRSMKLFVHRTFQEWSRSRGFAGSVVTGIADTPISTSGFLDDWGDPNFKAEDVRQFMAEDIFFLIPNRRLPWIAGGNRLGDWDCWHVFEGTNLLRIGMHSERGFSGPVNWSIEGEGFQIGGAATAEVPPLEPMEVAEIVWDAPAEQRLTLTVNGRAWPIECVKRGRPVAFPLLSAPTVEAPAFREAAYEFRHPSLAELFEGRWHTLLVTLPPVFLDPDGLPPHAEVLATRIDARTHQELPVVARTDEGIATTLRTGDDPAGVLVSRTLAALA